MDSTRTTFPRTARGMAHANSAARRRHVGCVYQAYAAVRAVSATIERRPEHGSATSIENGWVKLTLELRPEKPYEEDPITVGTGYAPVDALRSLIGMDL